MILYDEDKLSTHQSTQINVQTNYWEDLRKQPTIYECQNIDQQTQTDNTFCLDIKNTECQCFKLLISQTLCCLECKQVFCFKCFIDRHQMHNVSQTIHYLQFAGDKIRSILTASNKKYRELIDSEPEIFIFAALKFQQSGRVDSQFNPQLMYHGTEITNLLYWGNLGSANEPIDFDGLIAAKQRDVIKYIQMKIPYYQQSSVAELQRIQDFRKLLPQSKQDKRDLLAMVLCDQQIQLKQEHYDQLPWDLNDKCVINAKLFMKFCCFEQ